ncbi:hypothetical protein [Pseudoprimorskyibacter insulae]|uniref:CTP synthetase n=1 Tax=Pseudoprimorskyibacter insulae TaxID=1695997 RepID=A0A2R8AVB0_9RHOB|nr:hypothetical protein [Pseudoprimorskyibacter insulae]SPF79968.1 hypothetical protein PRI8871_01770 [Pseudoprimorskyibacter insulae]
MFRLASLIFSLLSTTLAGTAVVVALVSGATSLAALLTAAAAGAGLAIPVSYLLARRLYRES